MSSYKKRIDLLLSEIYKEFPFMRRHPDYRFYYIHWGYPTLIEYFIVVTQYIPETSDDNFNVFVNSMSKTLGFYEGVLITQRDFEENIMKQYFKAIDDLRGSEFKIFLYEIW